uniref:FZ domain-containing protein n=1 Tax=Hanusia phi TaxID=3032 RepID=A0A7S0EZL8_9CRYP|mmetsp:Transcript_33952/g.76310  ORF Transcript_33952/g.76310 Transcript_33952/m.76310 type:complete len:176 (+) Transcript_33952:282-809(+)
MLSRLVLTCLLLIWLSTSSALRFCMANCSLPMSNEFCYVSEDVCAFPTGDLDAKMAVRAMKLQDNSADCIDYFGKFMCAMYFPPCQFRVIAPLCYTNCVDAYRNCGASRSVAKGRCTSLSSAGMIAAEGDGSCRKILMAPALFPDDIIVLSTFAFMAFVILSLILFAIWKYRNRE